jgi:hypothetical protein
MARKGKSTEETIGSLREAEVRLQGKTAGKNCRSIGFSEQTQYKWRREYELHITHYDPVPALFSA